MQQEKRKEITQQDRRKLKRRYLMFYSRIFDRKTGSLIGYLSDITIEGMMIISEDPLQTGVVHKLRMDLPEDIFGRGHLDFEAYCIWSHQDVNPNFYIAGFKLEELKEEDKGIVEKIIESYGFRERQI
jgi:hypothetical protein